jgi:ABC-type microcin C transport system permease subunit YejE
MHTTPPLPTSLRPYPEPYLWILIISKGKKATFSSCPPNTQSLMQTHPPKRAFYPPNTITLSVQNKGKDIKSGSRCRTLCTDKRGRNSTSLLLASLRALILLAGLALTSISLYTTDRACGVCGGVVIGMPVMKLAFPPPAAMVGRLPATRGGLLMTDPGAAPGA